MHQKANKILLAPTDLSNFLNCRHLSALDLPAARGLAKRPSRYGPFIDELKAPGVEHELEYLKHLEEKGLSVVRIADPASGDLAKSGLERTTAAMREGADVIYQATLADDTWSGRADFQRKVDVPSDVRSWSYAVIDTKLVRDTKAGTILQLCIYSYLLGKLQGVRPEFMYVVTPGTDFAPAEYRVADYRGGR